MFCLNCGKILTEEIDLFNIFRKSYHQICEQCFYKFDHVEHLDVVPIMKGVLYHVTLFKGKYLKDAQALSQYLIPYILYVIKQGKDNLIYIDDMYHEETFLLLSKFSNINIYYVVIFEKTSSYF